MTKRRPTIDFVTRQDLRSDDGREVLGQTQDLWSTGDLHRGHGAAGGDVPVPRPPTDSGPYDNRGIVVVRVRARSWLLEGIEKPNTMSPGGCVEIPTREHLGLGEDVGIELSLGALADPVALRGRVIERFEQARNPSAGRTPSLLIRIEPEHADRVMYVHAVLRGERKATARRFQRVPTDLTLTWFEGSKRFGGRVSNISRGGAFLCAAHVPVPGTRVTVMLPDGDEGAIALTAAVAWHPPGERPDGFGVSFKFGDREEAAIVHRVVQRHRMQLGATA